MEEENSAVEEDLIVLEKRMEEEDCGVEEEKIKTES